MMRRTFTILSSWWLTALLVLVLAAAYASLTFGKDPWPRWTDLLVHSTPGLLLYLGLILNLSATTVRIALTRLRAKALTTNDILRMDNHAEISVPGDAALPLIAAWMQKQGLAPLPRQQEVHAASGRFSFLPGMVFRLGVILFLGSLFASAHLRQTGQKALHQGETMTFSGKTAVLDTIKTDLPDDLLQVGEDSPLRLDAVSAELTVDGRQHTITSHAPERVQGLYYRIIHLGYAQPITVKGLARSFAATLDLDILPPGKSAVVSLPQDDRFLTFTLEPERTITKGLLKGKQYDLQKPRYHILVQKGSDQNKPQGIEAKPGSQGAAAGLSLSLGEQGLYVVVETVHDPALFWVYAGLLLILAGTALMPLRFFWYEKRFSAAMEGKSVVIGYSEEFYRKWGAAKFQDLKAELDMLKRP